MPSPIVFSCYWTKSNSAWHVSFFLPTVGICSPSLTWPCCLPLLLLSSKGQLFQGASPCSTKTFRGSGEACDFSGWLENPWASYQTIWVLELSVIHLDLNLHRKIPSPFLMCFGFCGFVCFQVWVSLCVIQVGLELPMYPWLAPNSGFSGCSLPWGRIIDVNRHT